CLIWFRQRLIFSHFCNRLFFQIFRSVFFKDVVKISIYSDVAFLPTLDTPSVCLRAWKHATPGIFVFWLSQLSGCNGLFTSPSCFLPDKKENVLFIISLHYIVGLDEINQHLDAHVAYLKKQYAAGHFLASGRKIPRTGGIIIATAASKEALVAILAEDPFQKAGLAEYAITEFIPSMVADGLETLLTR
ncbi:MAG: YciI family protein, partial [Desulfobulbus sp.]